MKQRRDFSSLGVVYSCAIQDTASPGFTRMDEKSQISSWKLLRGPDLEQYG